MLHHYPMVLNDEYKHCAFGPCRVLSIHGFNNSGVDKYLQLHSVFPSVLTNGDVPNFKSLWFPAGAQSIYGRETFGDAGLAFDELLAAVSSTEVNYTAVVNSGIDATIVFESDYPVLSTTTIAGDLVTGDDEREVWASAAGPKKLRRVDFLAGTDISFPILQARSGAMSVNNRTKVLEKCAVGIIKTFLFGPEGGQFEELVSPDTIYRGCQIASVKANGSGQLPNPIVIISDASNAMRVVYE